MQTSLSQVRAMLGTEGFESRAYPDGMVNGVQMFSIGYGHQIRPNESYLLTSSIDSNKAFQLFQSDLSPLENILNNVGGLNQNEFDALIDFGYNCGEGALNNILDTWDNGHDLNATVSRMQLYNKTRVGGVLQVSQDLVARRAKERSLFLTPDSGSQVITLAPGTKVTIIAGLAVGALAFVFLS